MKYTELSRDWQKVAIAMEINLCQETVNEIAIEQGVESWKVSEDSEEVKDALADTDYDFEKDVFGKDKLIRTN